LIKELPGVIWTRLVKDTDSLRKAIFIALCFMARFKMKGLWREAPNMEIVNCISYEDLFDAVRHTTDLEQATLLNA
jgi:hypothetical protein